MVNAGSEDCICNIVTGFVVPTPALPVLLRTFVCATAPRGQPKKSASAKTTVAVEIFAVNVSEFVLIFVRLFQVF